MRGLAKKKILRAPYGWEFLPAGQEVIPRPVGREMWILRYMKQLRAFGCDAAEIAQELGFDRIRTRLRTPWSAADVAAVLAYDDSLLWKHWREQRPLLPSE